MPLKKLIGAVLFMALTGFLSAQTAEELDRILDAGEITYTQAARFVLRAANAMPQNGDALRAARENRWLPQGAEANRPVSLGDLSLLIMKAFGLKGGILYSLFPGPRYACRELVYLRIIQGRSDPGEGLDGGAFLQILGRVLTHTGIEESST